MKALPESFFRKETTKLAQELLGCYLVRKWNSHILLGQIVETEAYLGIQDPCCHSFQGRKTERTKAMYLSAGHSYIYFTYGMYYCFNVVTKNEKEPEAVLIRALKPLKGLDLMRKNRKQNQATNLCSGPGKLCQAFHITKALNKKKLFQTGELFISKGEKVRGIEMDRRVGLPLHKDSAYWFLRFYIKNNPHVSVKKNQIS